jgi:hypothetical protein
MGAVPCALLLYDPREYQSEHDGEIDYPLPAYLDAASVQWEGQG